MSCLPALYYSLEPEDSQNKRRQLSGPFLSHLTANQRGFSLGALAPEARCEIYITVLFTYTNMTSLFIFTSRSERVFGSAEEAVKEIAARRKGEFLTFVPVENNKYLFFSLKCHVGCLQGLHTVIFSNYVYI